MEILRGQVVIEAEVAKALAEVEAATQQIRRSMAEVDQMDAEAEVRVDTRRLRRQIAEAKAEIKSLEAEKIDIRGELNDDDRKRISADLKRLRKELKELESEELIVRVNDDELKDLEKTTKRVTKAEEDRQKAFRDMARVQAEALRMDTRRSNELQRQHVLHAQTTRDIAKLRSSYAKLLALKPKMERQSWLGGQDAIQELDKLNSELEFTRRKIVALGGTYRDVKPHEEDQVSRLQKWGQSLGSVRLQMGFFSATLRQTATAFTLLGPVLFALGGQIASLVGVLGTGLAGAIAVSTAGVIGFGGAALGVGLIMKPLIADLQDAKKASDAYGDAVRKYGKGSSEAKTAQEKLNKTLGDIGPAARQGFAQLGQLSDRWSKLTAGNRTSFFDTFGKGIKLASSYLPMFARESNKTFKTAMQAGEDWIDLFDSPQARGGIQQMLSGFRAAIPGLNSGFMSLAKTIGAIGKSASRWLEPLSEGFADWADNLFKSINTGKLDGQIDRLVGHMRDIGHFAQSAGRMLAAFFNSGANEGANLLNTLTDIFNSWTAWMNSAAGQKGLADFFSQANQIGSQFIGTIAQIGIALFEFSAAFAPLSQGALAFVHAISSVVAAIMSLAPARAILTAIGGALAGAFVVGRIAAAVVALNALRTALVSLQVAGGISGMFASMFNPLMAAGAAIGALIAIAAMIPGQMSAAEQGLNNFKAAVDATNTAIKQLNQIDADAISSGLDVASAKLGVAEAQRTLNQAVSQYGPNSLEARRATIGLQMAQDYLATTTEDFSSTLEKQGRVAQRTFEKQNGAYLEQSRLVQDLRDNVADLRRQHENNPAVTTQERVTEAVRELNKEEARLIDLRQAADRANQRVMQSDLQMLRAKNKSVGVVKGLGDAWSDVKDVMSGVSAAGQKAIGGIFKADPKKASAVVRQVAKAVNYGLGQRANQILINPKLNDGQVLKQLRGLTNQAQVLVEPKVRKGKAEREIKNLGQGKTATINAKAETKQAKRQFSQLTGKQLVQRIAIRADDGDAISKLNRVQRYNLKQKLLRMGANPAAVMAAIALINNKKIPAKIAQFKAETNEAEAGNKKVQGFKNKSVDLTARWTGQADVAMAQSAIDSVQGKTVYLDLVTRRSGGAAAGGPVGFASGGAVAPSPSQQERHARSAERADVRQNRGGIYRRPSLLVGEENKKEYVISTNDSYRGANINYLRAAASEFGYALNPIEMAAAGKGAGKAFSDKRYNKMTGRGSKKTPKAQDLAETRTRYDWLKEQIASYEAAGSNERTKQDRLIEAGTRTTYDKPKLLKPYESALDLYPKLRKTIRNMIDGLRSNLGRQLSIDRGISDKGKNNDLYRLRKRVKELRRSTPKEERDKSGKTTNRKEIREHEKQIRIAEKQLQDATERNQNAKSKIPGLKDRIAQLQRELKLSLPNDRDALVNTIEQIKLDQPGSSGGGDPIGIQMGAFDASRYELFKQFGSNVAGAYSAPASGMPVVPGAPIVGGSSSSGPSFYASGGSSSSGPMGLASGAPRAGGYAAPAAAVAGGKTVNQTINISEPPPDPHSFTKQLGWEAAAMLG